MAAFLRKYNVTLSGGTLIRIPIIKRGVVDYAVGADWTPSAGDVKVSKDGGAAANIGTLPSAVAMGNTAYWEFTLTGTELSAKQVVVTVADSATKAVEDQFFVVETFGDASAMYQADLSAANIPANVTQFGGTNGTFSSGRPEVNTSHWGGTAVGSTEVRANLINIAGSAVSTSSAQLGVNVVNWGGSATPVTNLNTVFNTDFAANYNTTNDGWVVKLGDYAHGGTSANTTLGTLTVGGTTSLAAVTTSGTVTLNALTVSNATTLTGNVSLGGTLGVTGLVTFSAFTVTNALTVGTNAIPWNAAYDAEVQSEVQDAIEVNQLDHLIQVADPGAVVANNSFLAKLVSKSATAAFSSYDNTTDSLEAIRDNTGTAQTGDAYAIVNSGTHGNAALKTLIDAVQADLPQRITKNTALSAFMFFMVLSSDHVTGATGKTVTATRSLDGAAFGACANSVTEVANGWYKIDLAAADLNANVVALKFTATDCDARMITLITQPT